ncbi:T9SS type A sorting domain-containing protein [Flammeovirga sp. OC4]|uniref:T9SS type A sorting domain-containing protein n=1 Tax=Flammeovirga sp. OC4 TaxID=1382345 RepID=UPI0005C66DF3|nr:T9SS type A sorting domain-containing protein [Flammeovirga sp. OC4]
MRTYKVILQLVSIFILVNCNIAIGFSQDIFSGGNGNGTDTGSYADMGSSPSVDIFNGGNGIGATNDSPSFTENTTEHDIFGGGNATGAGSDTYEDLHLPGVTVMSVFYGGNAKGDASASTMVDDFGDLPVELGTFEVLNIQGKAVIKWQTLWEINNDYFEVERSLNRRSWKVVKKVKGVGNSNASIAYQTEDEYPLNGLSYYRLKQVDFDGTTSYSEMKTFSTSKTFEIELVAYPNPLEEQLTILVDQVYHSRVQLFTITGQIVHFDSIESKEGSMTIALPFLERGMYILKVANVGSLVLMK